MILIFYIISILNAFEIVEQSNNISVCSGETVEIFVLADKDNLNYQWYKDGVKIDFNTSNIILNNVNSSISGDYYCEVKDLNTNKSVESSLITVNIKNKSEILTKENEVILFENQIANLKCEINDLFENSQSNFKWYDKNWNLINDDFNIAGSKSNLLSIKPLNKSLDKVYCVLSGDCGTDTAIFNFQYYDILLPDLQNRTICEDYEINLKFEIFETRLLKFPNDYTIKVYNEKGIILNTYTTYKDYEIEFVVDDIMTIEKTGKYKCDIEFEGKTISFDLLELSIYKNTKLIKKNDDLLTYKEGERISLFLEATGNIQNYIWLKDGVQVGTTENPIFYKHNTRKEDSGTYTCIAKNFCKDTTFFMAEVEVIENAIYLSRYDIEKQKQNIDFLVDLYGNIYYLSEKNQFRNINNGLYIVKFSDNTIKKYFKYE